MADLLEQAPAQQQDDDPIVKRMKALAGGGQAPAAPAAPSAPNPDSALAARMARLAAGSATPAAPAVPAPTPGLDTGNVDLGAPAPAPTPTVTAGAIRPIGVPQSEVDRLGFDTFVKNQRPDRQIANRLAALKGPDGYQSTPDTPTFAGTAAHLALNNIASMLGLGKIADADDMRKLEMWTRTGGNPSDILVPATAGSFDPGLMRNTPGTPAVTRADLLGLIAASGGVAGAELGGKALGPLGDMVGTSGATGAGVRAGIKAVAKTDEVAPSRAASVGGKIADAMRGRLPVVKEAAVSGAVQGAAGGALGAVDDVTSGERDPKTIAKDVAGGALQFGLLGGATHLLAGEGAFRTGRDVAGQQLDAMGLRDRLAKEKLARTPGEPGAEYEANDVGGRSMVRTGEPPMKGERPTAPTPGVDPLAARMESLAKRPDAPTAPTPPAPSSSSPTAREGTEQIARDAAARRAAGKDADLQPTLPEVDAKLADLKQKQTETTDENRLGHLASRIRMLESQRRTLTGEPEPEVAGAERARAAKAAGVRSLDTPPAPAAEMPGAAAPQLSTVQVMDYVKAHGLEDVTRESQRLIEAQDHGLEPHMVAEHAARNVVAEHMAGKSIATIEADNRALAADPDVQWKNGTPPGAPAAPGKAKQSSKPQLPATAEEARAMGREAFAKGLPATPALDETLTGRLGASPKGASKLLTEWHRGWAEANVAAPNEPTAEQAATEHADGDRVMTPHGPGVVTRATAVGDRGTYSVTLDKGIPLGAGRAPRRHFAFTGEQLQPEAPAAARTPDADARRTASVAHGHTHLDAVLARGESPVGREIRSVHDQTVTGKVTQARDGMLTVEWSGGPTAGQTSMIPHVAARDFVALPEPPATQLQRTRAAETAKEKAAPAPAPASDEVAASSAPAQAKAPPKSLKKPSPMEKAPPSGFTDADKVPESANASTRARLMKPASAQVPFREHYERELRAQLAKNPDQFAYGAEQVPSVVDKMMTALGNGHANFRDSAALKRAAKAAGVPFTKAGLQEAARGGNDSHAWYIGPDDRPRWTTTKDAAEGGYRGPYNLQEAHELTGTHPDYLIPGMSKPGEPVYTPDYPAPTAQAKAPVSEQSENALRERAKKHQGAYLAARARVQQASLEFDEALRRHDDDAAGAAEDRRRAAVAEMESHRTARLATTDEIARVHGPEARDRATDDMTEMHEAEKKASAPKPAEQGIAYPKARPATVAPAGAPIPPKFDTPVIRSLREQANAVPAPENTPERIQWRVGQAEQLTATATRFDRRADLVLGLPGAGKSSVATLPLVEGHGGANLDADVPKQNAPEYQNGIGAKALLPESSAIRQRALELAVQQGANIVYPTIGHPTDTPDLVRALQAQGYEVHVHMVDVPPEVAAERSTDGFLKGGRHFVDPADTLHIGDRPRRAYAALAGLPGVTAHDPIDNNVPHGSAPRAVADWRDEWQRDGAGVPEGAQGAAGGRSGRGRSGSGDASEDAPNGEVADGARGVRRDVSREPEGQPPRGVRESGEGGHPGSGREGGGRTGTPDVRLDAGRAPEAAAGSEGLPEPRPAPHDARVDGAGSGDRGDRGAPAKRARRDAGRVRGHNYELTPEAATGLLEGGLVAKARANLDAIALLKTIEAEQRPATRDEQTTLSRYVGWGGMPHVFDPEHPQYAKSVGPTLRELLTDTEWEAARASTPNAHYTSPAVIDAVHALLARLGFSGGQLLEPSMGAGYFLGLTPPERSADYRWLGVELDAVTGRIGKLLYPESDIRVQGFQDLQVPDGYVDVAVGNVPFGNYKVHDPRYNALKLSIHNYFFRKTLDLVRPGGVVAYITSAFTMDARDSSVRKEFAKHADLLGAIRLPGDAFKGIANTDVTTDLIVLRRRAPGEAATGPAWASTVPTKVPGKTGETEIGLNEYFAAHPEMVLGELRGDGTMNARFGDAAEMRVKSTGPIEPALATAVQRFGAEGQRYVPREVTSPASKTPQDMPIIFAPETVRDYGLTVEKTDGKIMQRRGGVLVDAGVPKSSVARVTKLIGLRDLTKAALAAQIDDASEATIERTRKALDRAYTAFVREYGPILKETRLETKRLNQAGEPIVQVRTPNLTHFEDGERALVTALEHYDPESGTSEKGDILVRRVYEPRKTLERVDTPSDALPIVLAEVGKVDLPRIARLAGVAVEDAAAALRGQIFEDPAHPGTWKHVDEYTSGDVKTKLAELQERAKADPGRWADNLKALEAAIPEDLPPSQISVRLGAPWIPTSDIERFVREVIGEGTVGVSYTPAGNVGWKVNADWRVKNAVNATTEFGTPAANAVDLIEDALNLKTPTVYFPPDRDGKRAKNPDATLAAQEKQQQLQDRFERWVWEEPARAARLARTYNDRFNRIRNGTPDGAHLTLPGSAAYVKGRPFALRPHQKNAIWRILTNGNTLLAHVVGSGKTFTMIAAGMEAKRLGLARKPMFVVPNHMLDQFSTEFKQLYPAADLLLATKEDFAKEERKAFVARAATNNWDGIVMTHRSFESIPMSNEFQERYIRQQVDELEDAIREAKKAKSERALIKQIEKAKFNLEAKLEGLMAEGKKDQLLSFEQTGADMLFVDEADQFKNLMFTTKLEGVAAPASQRAFDLYMKSMHLESVNPGRGLVFATGTPIANAVAEMFTMQRYLQMKALRERGISSFDAWAATFGRTVTGMEMKPDNSGFRLKTRFAAYNNVGELAQLFRQVTDVQTAEDLDLPRPKLAGGKMQIHTAPMSGPLKAYVKDLARRGELVQQRKVEPDEDNWLKITSDGRRAALDMRLVDALALDLPDSKLNQAIDNIYGIWQRNASLKGAQLVFSDLSTPGSDPAGQGGVPGFNVYDDIKRKLLAKGIPAKEVRFIHDAKTDDQKKKLFADVRAGRVRVLIGSTEKMGAGTNVQDRLTDLHNLDAPWRPRDIEQRHGRILRQGNTLYDTGKIPHVGIHTYITEGSFDGYIWQNLERKAGFIKQALTADAATRSIEDVGEVQIDWATAKAIASGNPMVKEKAEVDAQIQKLERLERAHRDEAFSVQRELASLPAQIAGAKAEIAKGAADVARTVPTNGDKFTITVGGATIAKRPEGGEAIKAAVQKAYEAGLRLEKGKEAETPLGTFAGFHLSLIVHRRVLTGLPEVYLGLRGDDVHTREIGENDSPASLLAQLEAMPASIAKQVEHARAKLESSEKRLAALKEKGAGAFPKAKELADLRDRQKAIDTELAKAASEPEGGASVATESPAFKRWFGDSKVVDAEGKPLVVYHGTTAAPFDTFKIGRAAGWGDGIYFTDNETQAAEEFGHGPTGRVIPAYVKIERPFTSYGIPEGIEGTKAWKDVAARWKGDVQDAWQEDSAFVGKALRELGYDGIIVDGSNSIQGKEIVAFAPNQVKHATGNSGAFDGGNPNMMMGFADPITAVYHMIREVRRLSKARKARQLERGQPERVKAAAVRLPSGRVVDGVNHQQALERAVRAGLVRRDWHPNYDRDDGWTTTHGRFVNREAGYRIAERAQQLRGRSGSGELTHDTFAGGGRQTRAYGFADPITATVAALAQTAKGQAAIAKTIDWTAAANKALQSTFNASNVTEDAGRVSRVIREHRAQMDRDVAKAHQLLAETRGTLDTLAAGAHYDGPRWEWYHRMEAGDMRSIAPSLRDISDAVRKVQDDVAAEIRALGPGHLDAMNENYMARVYKEGPAIKTPAASQLGRTLAARPMEGRKSFKKARSFATLQDALDAGYVPISDNPLDMVLLKVREMRRYLMAHRIKDEMKGPPGQSKAAKAARAVALVRYKPASQPMPDGYAKINDSAFTVFAQRGAQGETRIRGEYIASAEVANVLNNFLSPGLRGKVWYDAYAGLGNVLNMVQLGLSAFHAGFVAFDATVQLAATGLDQMLFGKGAGARASGAGKMLLAGVSAATGPLTVLPLPAAIASYLTGRKVWHAYMHDAQTAEMATVIDGLVQGGGRAKMDDYYRSNAITRTREAFRDKRWSATVLNAPFAALAATMHPLMEHVVPRMKMGAIYHMMQAELAKLPPTATDDEVRTAAARVVDAVDARLGQMIYDNRFWHRATKEMMMAGIRSVGWNVGTFDVTLGAGAQLVSNAIDLGHGRRPAAWHKLEYLACLAAIVALYGAIYTYLHTGQGPRDWKDYYFPRTGKKDHAGNDERATLPTYMKDIFALARHPGATVIHKAHPLLETAAEMFQNKNFYGDEILNPDDPAGKKVMEAGKYLVTDVLRPFSVQNALELKKRGEGPREMADGVLGIQAAPREVVRSDAQNKMAEYLGSRGHPTRTPDERAAAEERQDITQGLRDGTVKRDSLRLLVRQGDLTPGQATRAAVASRENPLVTKFKMLSPAEAQRVYDLGTDEEKALWERALRLKVRRLRRPGQLADAPT